MRIADLIPGETYIIKQGWHRYNGVFIGPKKVRRSTGSPERTEGLFKVAQYGGREFTFAGQLVKGTEADVRAARRAEKAKKDQKRLEANARHRETQERDYPSFFQNLAVLDRILNDQDLPPVSFSLGSRRSSGGYNAPALDLTAEQVAALTPYLIW